MVKINGMLHRIWFLKLIKNKIFHKMKFILFATLIIAASVTADYPDPAYACVQQANDPTWGPYCTQVSFQFFSSLEVNFEIVLWI
jgi:hypothetical protein